MKYILAAGAAFVFLYASATHAQDYSTMSDDALAKFVLKPPSLDRMMN